MGDRGNIVFKQKDGQKIFFYTHWQGSDIEDILRNAMIRGKERWDDEPYLARIIFSELIKNDVEGLTGYGLSTQICDNEHDLLVVDMKKKHVRVRTEGRKTKKIWKTFEDFVKGT